MTTKKNLPNYLKKHKVISISTCGLNNDLVKLLEELGRHEERQQFVADALNNYYLRYTDFKSYINQIITLNRGLVKHLLRKAKHLNKLNT